MVTESSGESCFSRIAAAKPASLPALAAISGVGEGKLDRYGEAVLGLISS